MASPAGQEGVPALVVVLLVAGSFMLGTWTQRMHQAEITGQGQTTSSGAAPQIEAQRHLRRLAIQPKQTLPSLLKDPLHTPTLENFMLESSGLLRVRPPIQPAASGEQFLRVIPFQILSWMPR